ncbi:MAG: F0F1 ATP synthase subunit B [Epsilonproteobacteria bacterium]|nr:F0F1 ATP synthase subunit B [Campylobacterota bacterium]
MKKIVVLSLMLSSFAFASGGNAETDIVQRTVNFLLFAGLVWYLVAEPVKSYFAGRTNAIADQLKKAEEKLNESMALKKEALNKISEAEKFAEELVEASKRENKILNDGIMAQCNADLENMVKQQAVLVEFEERKMVRSVVEEVLNEVLSQSADSFDKEAMANIILKKVA